MLLREIEDLVSMRLELPSQRHGELRCCEADAPAARHGNAEKVSANLRRVDPDCFADLTRGDALRARVLDDVQVERQPAASNGRAYGVVPVVQAAERKRRSPFLATSWQPPLLFGTGGGIWFRLFAGGTRSAAP
jgi:hypothetical protein